MSDTRVTQLITDQDIDDYSSYIAKFAAIAQPGDPPATSFRLWFIQRYDAIPATALVRNSPAKFDRPQTQAA